MGGEVDWVHCAGVEVAGWSREEEEDGMSRESESSDRVR